MKIKKYQYYIYSLFLRIFILVSIVFFCIVVILNFFEEIKFSEKYNIHRTRTGFPNNGIDTFTNMAEKGILVADRTIQEQMGGKIDTDKDCWYIPAKPVDDFFIFQVNSSSNNIR